MKVEVSRFVGAPPAVVERVLSPVTLVEAEGSFDVRNVTDTADGTRVRAGAHGVELVFEFDEREDGIEYVQREGPLDRLETVVTYAAENEGTRLRARSEVVVGGPGALDRLAAWKRRGELKRALSTLADTC